MFDLFYDVPSAGNETSDLVIFVIRVELGNSTRFIVQVIALSPPSSSHTHTHTRTHKHTHFTIISFYKTLISLQASLSDPLDLGYFACEQVSVSFAVINNNRMLDGLNFSPKVEVFVHGGKLSVVIYKHGVDYATHCVLYRERPSFSNHSS